MDSTGLAVVPRSQHSKFDDSPRLSPPEPPQVRPNLDSNVSDPVHARKNKLPDLPQGISSGQQLSANDDDGPSAFIQDFGLRPILPDGSVLNATNSTFNIVNANTYSWVNTVTRYDEETDQPSVMFQTSMDRLDRTLLNLSNEARQIGSSAPLLSSSYEIRHQLTVLLFLFQQNERFFRDVPDNDMKKLLRVAKSAIGERVNVGDFPAKLRDLANLIPKFLDGLNYFPEVANKDVTSSLSLLNSSVLAFQTNLTGWASDMSHFSGQFQSESVQTYIYNLMTDFSRHNDHITYSLTKFLDIGIPAIRFEQSNGTSNLQTLATISTFLSGVIVTALGFTFPLRKTTLVNVVSCFWFVSMVFSMVAAVNSFLALAWGQAVYRPPSHRVPRLVSLWVRKSPLAFLVLAVVGFFAGLSVFVFASSQSLVTSGITVVFTVCTMLGLLVVSAWFLLEQWTYLHYEGNKPFWDVAIDAMNILPAFLKHVWNRDMQPISTDLINNIPTKKKQNTLLRVFTNSQTLTPFQLEAAVEVAELPSDSAPMCQLQFSLCGRHLVASSLRCIQIMTITDPKSCKVIMRHQEIVGRLAQPPRERENALLTKLNHQVNVYSNAPQYPLTILERNETIDCIAWFPGGNEFILAENTVITKLDLYGKTLETYHLDSIKLHSVCVTPDSERLVGVGALLKFKPGSNQDRYETEKYLVVYNLQTGHVEDKTNVNDARDITMTRDGGAVWSVIKRRHRKVLDFGK